MPEVASAPTRAKRSPEELYAGKRSPLLEQSGYSRITDDEMRRLMIEASEKLARMLRLKRSQVKHAHTKANWPRPPSFSPLFFRRGIVSCCLRKGAIAMRRRSWMVVGNGRTGRLLLNWQRRSAGFPLTVIQVEERARYLGALDQGHAGQLLDLQTLIANAVGRSLDLAAGGK